MPLGGCILETNRITQNLSPEEESTPQEHLKFGTILEERYQIDNLVGSGGMSTVYRAREGNDTSCPR